jgi:hypothetical protein
VDAAFNPALVRGLGRSPEGVGYNLAPEYIVPTNHPHQCKHWMRVVTQGYDPVVTIEGTAFGNYDAIFNYYLTTIGVSPYFTYGGYLFKFIYTGYDAKTGKYHKGGKNEILICTDGLFLENTGHGNHYVSRKSKLGSGAAIGGVMGLPRGVGLPAPVVAGVKKNFLAPPPPSLSGSGTAAPTAPTAIVNTTLKAGAPGTYSPSDASPIASSLAVNDATMAALLAASQPQPTQYYAPPGVAPAGMSTTAMVVVGLLGIAVLGGVTYLVLE